MATTSAPLLHYRPWQGTLRGSTRLVWPIARVSLAMLFRRRIFWVVYGLSLTLFLMFFFGQYLLAWAEAQATEASVPLFGARIETKKLIEVLQKALKLNGSAETYRNFIQLQANMVMIVLAMAGSILVGNDFRCGSLPFYLSKPVNRWHYLGGKCLAVAVFVNLLTTLPALALFVQYAMLGEDWSYFRGEGSWIGLGDFRFEVPVNPLLFGILGYGLVLTVCLSLFLVATATWLRKAVPMIMAWTTMFIFVRLFTNALVDGLHMNPRWRLFDLWHNTAVVGKACLGMDNFSSWTVFESAFVLGAACTVCLIYLNLRIRAVEVVR
jgi:hypothetical protein